MTQKLLITGGLGYVGGRLIKQLTSRPNLSLRITTRRANDTIPAWTHTLDLAQTDLENLKTLSKALDGVHTVVHLAALNAHECSADEALAERINVGGTRRLVDLAAKRNVQRIVYLSTAHVYASPLQGLITEETPTTNLHPYAATHRRAEDLVLEGAVPATVIRLSNAFGPPCHAGVNCWMLLVNDLCRQAVTQRKLMLRGNGLDQRDFVSLSNVTNGFKHLLNLPQNLWNGEIFNFGSGKSCSVIEMAELIAERCQELFGFRTRIKLGAGEDNYPSLSFSNQRFASTGFSFVDDSVAEIDATLHFCKVHFGG